VNERERNQIYSWRKKKNIIKKKVQGQALGFIVIWVLFLTKLGKKLKDNIMILYIFLK